MGGCHHSPWASNFNDDFDFHDGDVDDVVDVDVDVDGQDADDFDEKPDE